MRIVIVDDHNLFREGLASLIQREQDVEIVGLAGNVQEAVDVVRESKPDIVLMDFGLPDGTGAEAAGRVLREHPTCKVIIITMSDKDEDLLAAIRNGAVGYLMKNMNPSKLVNAIRSVYQGESALSRSMTLRLMNELSRTKGAEEAVDEEINRLTPRERELLVELAKGKSNQEIAESLFISENTVKYHLHSIFEKLNFRDRKEAARYALAHGLLKKMD